MKRLLAALALVSVIFLAGCTGQSQPADQQPTTDEQVDAGNQQVSCEDQVQGDLHTVTYTSNGFSPSQIIIQRCDTVTWENEGGSPMWVASDQHPVHSQYGGTSLNQHCPNDGDVFDQCESGSSYSFTFTKTGEWSYHNHRLAGHGGTVTVQER